MHVGSFALTLTFFFKIGTSWIFRCFCQENEVSQFFQLFITFRIFWGNFARRSGGFRIRKARNLHQLYYWLLYDNNIIAMIGQRLRAHRVLGLVSGKRIRTLSLRLSCRSTSLRMRSLKIYFIISCSSFNIDID